jgi:hypothetical protein
VLAVMLCDTMRFLKTLILLTALISCNSSNDTIKSNLHWVTIVDSFPFKDLKQFSLDTSLLNSYYRREKVYQDFLKPKDLILDSILLTQQYYLYSWQQHDPSFTAFTVLKEGLGEALEMHYLIFNKSNHLVSDLLVANHGGEPGGHQYETKSYLKSKDTIISIKTRTFFVDQKTLEPLTQPVGDTVLFKQIIGNSGVVYQETIDSILTTQNFIDNDGWVTQNMVDKYQKRKKH